MSRQLPVKPKYVKAHSKYDPIPCAVQIVKLDVNKAKWATLLRNWDDLQQAQFIAISDHIKR